MLPIMFHATRKRDPERWEPCFSCCGGEEDALSDSWQEREAEYLQRLRMKSWVLAGIGAPFILAGITVLMLVGEFEGVSWI